MTIDDLSRQRGVKPESQDKIKQREAASIDLRSNGKGPMRGLLSHDPNQERTFDNDPLKGLGKADRGSFRPGQFSLQPRSWQYVLDHGSPNVQVVFKLTERSVPEVVTKEGGVNPNRLGRDLVLEPTFRRRPDLDRLVAICDKDATKWIRDRNYLFLLDVPDKVYGERLAAEFPEYRKALLKLPVMPDSIRRGVKLIEHDSTDWNTPFSSMREATKHGFKHRNTAISVSVDTIERNGLSLQPGMRLRIRLLEAIVPFEDMRVSIEHTIGPLERKIATVAGNDLWTTIRKLHRTQASILPHITATQTFFSRPDYFYWFDVDVEISSTGDVLAEGRLRLPGESARTKEELKKLIEADTIATREGRDQMLKQLEQKAAAETVRVRAARDALESMRPALGKIAASWETVLPRILKPLVK